MQRQGPVRKESSARQPHKNGPPSGRPPRLFSTPNLQDHTAPPTRRGQADEQTDAYTGMAKKAKKESKGKKGAKSAKKDKKEKKETGKLLRGD